MKVKMKRVNLHHITSDYKSSKKLQREKELVSMEALIFAQYEAVHLFIPKVLDDYLSGILRTVSACF